MAFKQPLLPRIKVPKLSKGQGNPGYLRQLTGLPVTNQEKLEILSSLGKGSYGIISKCRKDDKILVLKESMVDDDHSLCLFAKEARLMHSLDHENIVKFDSICYDTGNSINKFSVLMECSQFDFTPLGQTYCVSSLRDFLKYVDRFDFQGMEHLNEFIASDVCKGLSYLHNCDIVHRDLKPDNILVSNQHYLHLCEDDRAKLWVKKPIIAKLTDFGESRAAIVQTMSVVHTSTANVYRGSPAFMAPEIHLHDGHTKMSLTELKATDMWSLGMTLFSLINPNLRFPYQIDMEESSGNPGSYANLLKNFLQRKELPTHGEKYESCRTSTWSRILGAYNLCTTFQNRPTAGDVMRYMTAQTATEKTSDKTSHSKPELETDNLESNLNQNNHRPCEVTGYEDSKIHATMTAEHTANEEDMQVSNRTNESMCKQSNLPMKVVRGDFHQASSDVFTHGAAGTQCSTISLMAIIGASVTSHTKWTTADINNILIQGDREHVMLLKGLGWPQTRSNGLMDVDEFPSLMMYSLDEIDLKASIGILSDVSYCLAKDLRQVMLTTFEEKPCHHFMLRMADICTAILSSDETGNYSIFDSHARDENGNTSPEGSACLMHFETKNDLVTYLETKTDGESDSQIDIIPVDVQILWNDVKDDDQCDEDPIVVASVSGEPESAVTHTTKSNPSSDNETDSLSCKEGTGDVPFYNGNPKLPVYLHGKQERFTPSEAVKVLLKREVDKCTKLPLRVRENCAFVIDTSCLASPEDVKADMNGTYSKLLRIATWTISVDPVDMTVNILHKKRVDIPKFDEEQYHLFIHSKMNHAGLCRSIFTLVNKYGEVVDNRCLLQYHISSSVAPDDKVEFDVLPHGNRKHGDIPFYPTQRSTLREIKNALQDGSSSAVVYNKVSQSDGGIMAISHPGQIPRSRQQVYQCKQHLNNRYDDIEELMLYVQTKEDSIVLHHQDLPEDLWVLGTQQMCTDLQRFCHTTDESYPISVDPTFEFGPFEVTPITYRHLLLKNKRSGVHPVFLGPTAIHHSKDADTFGRIISSVTRSCPQLKTDIKGFITDGESALYNAMAESFPLATGLRCFRHVYNNCKQKLNEIGIRSKEDKTFFLNIVFGENGFVDCENATELNCAIEDKRKSLDVYEGKVLGMSEGYTSKFWKYIKKKEKMIANHMILCQRRKAGMPCDHTGKPHRPYTNQSESLNNILTRQKEAVSKAPKRKSPTKKLSFVKNVWEEVLRHQSNEISRALCGMSEEYCLTEKASYLQVKQEEWFAWSAARRAQYVEKFNAMTLDDVNSCKIILLPNHIDEVSKVPIEELFGPGFKEELRNAVDISSDVAETLIFEAEMLLKTPNAISQMPSMSLNPCKKFIVASKACKRGFYTCTLYADHVSCDCPSFKYQGICKHSLCISQKNDITTMNLRFVSKKKSKKHTSKLLNPVSDAAGKKGGHHKNPWRPRHQGAATETPNAPDKDVDNVLLRPFTDIHHNNLPFVVCFLEEEPKALECRQCGVEFPRYKLIRPFDIVLSHKEKWTYTTKDDPSKRHVSKKYTTKYYCVQSSCILRRFDYFNASLVKIDDRIMQQLSYSHKDLLRRELNLDIP